ncbi:hypothetical protein P4N68_12945 [Corynebacterium felinum]|uniref:Uncharacterized protein n=1 Tax=Corynebacterium felinum TaxID=131318 RepID=A0ABU2BEC0_9CORY|nr:hypothetical protein [Corynebacterium felinum]MDF5821975.1 hypothetical protein [Corynebacterium felinum]MDR7355729.1 hypothetical protein [Corynebacterium felinum]WJY95077.1 hypothetical protein CFELI_07315 [Corynebacterium felinum]
MRRIAATALTALCVAGSAIQPALAQGEYDDPINYSVVYDGTHCVFSVKKEEDHGDEFALLIRSTVSPTLDHFFATTGVSQQALKRYGELGGGDITSAVPSPDKGFAHDHSSLTPVNPDYLAALDRVETELSNVGFGSADVSWFRWHLTVLVRARYADQDFVNSIRRSWRIPVQELPDVTDHDFEEWMRQIAETPGIYPSSEAKKSDQVALAIQATTIMWRLEQYHEQILAGIPEEKQTLVAPLLRTFRKIHAAVVRKQTFALRQCGKAEEFDKYDATAVEPTNQPTEQPRISATVRPSEVLTSPTGPVKKRMLIVSAIALFFIILLGLYLLRIVKNTAPLER